MLAVQSDTFNISRAQEIQTQVLELYQHLVSENQSALHFSNPVEAYDAMHFAAYDYWVCFFFLYLEFSESVLFSGKYLR